MIGLLVASAALAVVPQPNELVVKDGFVPTNAPVTVVRDASIAPEGYVLDVDPAGTIAIRSSDDAGAFYARQTLRQLTGPDGIACVVAKDAPAYRWRGFHLDDCRHFFGKEYVKKVLNLMAYHKLNVFHWHLTEDQGWRLEIPGRLELITYGAVRPESVKPGARMTRDKNGDYAAEMDGQPYGPFFYTEQDVKEILAYAAERHITVVPEIDLPGHMAAALAAYPHLACRPDHFAKRVPRTLWGIEKDVLCLGNDETIRFIDDILDYVCRLFPSKVIHIGGDECPQVRWKDCPKCQKRIRDEKLGDEKGLQPWIVRHCVTFLAARGRRALGWDEYLLGEGIPKDAIGMSWRTNPKGGAGHKLLRPADIVARGHDLVMTPNRFCYLDYPQGIADDPFQYIGNTVVTLEKAYSLDPAANIPEAQRVHVLGGQANNWAEYTWGPKDLEWKAWPRACALAEVFWCGAKKPGYADFSRRLVPHRARLLKMGVNCAPLGL